MNENSKTLFVAIAGILVGAMVTYIGIDKLTERVIDASVSLGELKSSIVNMQESQKALSQQVKASELGIKSVNATASALTEKLARLKASDEAKLASNLAAIEKLSDDSQSLLSIQSKLGEAETRINALEAIEITSVIDAARAACYSALTGNNDHSLILVPLPNNKANLDKVCHTEINDGWHAGGLVKGRYFYQDCGDPLDNKLYGGSYTAYVTEKHFEGNRGKYPSCNKENAYICCSPQFPN